MARLPLLLLLLQLSIALTDFQNALFASAQAVDPNVCIETAGTDTIPPPPPNYHVSMAAVTSGVLGHVTIMRSANSSRASVTVASPTEELRAVLDGVTNQILLFNGKAEPSDVQNCQVQNSSSAAINSLMARVSFQGGDRFIPTGNFFNGAGLKITRKENEIVNGINAEVFRTCHYSAGLQLTLEVTWWYTVDTRVPVKAKSRYGKTSGNLVIETEYYPTPIRSMSDKQDATNHPFTAPRGVFCKGLISAKQAPSTYSRFSLGADRYMYNLPNVPAQGPDSLRESYDQSINVTMMEGEGIFQAIDKTKYGNGRLAKIHDFTRGISYVKNLRFENCTYEKITQGDWDNTGDRIKTPEEFYYPSLAELQYKGSGVYRTANVDIYIGYKDDVIDIGDGKKYPLTVEYYLNIKVIFDGTGNPTFKSVPLGLYYASPSKYTALTEVFDFSTGIPRAFDHDISDCFSAVQKRHFELVMPIDTLDPNYIKYLFDFRSEFTYALVKSLSIALNISPLRVIQPTVSVFADPLLMLVEITISDNATVPGYTPKQPEASLAQAVDTMADKIAKGTLIAEVTEGDLMFQVPVKDYVNLDARGSTVKAGMSTGAVAGLAVGMLLLGLALGIAIFFAIARFRNDPQFGFKSFEGPGDGK